MQKVAGCKICSVLCAGPGLDLTKLVIISGKQCWVVYVDVVLLAVEANVVDTVSLAVKVRYRALTRS